MNGGRADVAGAFTCLTGDFLGDCPDERLLLQLTQRPNYRTIRRQQEIFLKRIRTDPP